MSVSYEGLRQTDPCIAAALKIWEAANTGPGTLLELYLLSRGISVPSPPTLRFHPHLTHPSGGTWPAMIALVTRGDEPIAIHCTFLSRDGKGKAPVEPQNMMLGPCRGGVVWLGDANGPLLVSEGIETCLSAIQGAGFSALAALSTAGLRALELPASITNVVILPDGDAAGESAARNAGFRWAREGRRVRIARSPLAKDFNELRTVR